MAKSGYAGEVLNTYYLRFYWSTTYHPETNTSTVSIMPEESGGGSFGGEMLGTDWGGTGTSGVYINGVRKYTLDQYYGGDNKNFKNSAADWYHDFSPTVGSIGTAEVTHDANGDATFTARVKCTIFPYNFPSAGVYRKDLDTGTVTVTFHEDAPYTITYNANNGSGAPPAQNVYAGTNTLSSTKPSRTGYTFAGWNTNSSGTGTNYSSGGTISISGNITLYAKWTINSYTLTTKSSNTNYGTVTSGGSLNYHETKSLTASISNKSGYTTTFTNWTVSGSGSSLSSTTSNPTTFTMGTANATVTATFSRTANKYYVHFDGQGASGTMSNQEFTYGTSQALKVNTFTKSGYNFVHWNTESDGTGNSYSDGATVSNLAYSGTITLYAIWQQSSFPVTYNANGHGTAPASQLKIPDQSLTLQPFIATQSIIGTTSNYVITGNANGGTWVSSSDGSASRTPTDTYTQSNWNTLSTGAGTSYGSEAVYTANTSLSLYAIWDGPATIYTYTYNVPTGTLYKDESINIIFDANGGSNSKPSQSANRTCPFSGWYTYDNIVRDSTSQVSASETVYAHYDDTIEFSSVILPTASECSLAGSSLLGWATSSDSNTIPQYSPGAILVPTAPQTLYAVWGNLGRVYINNDSYSILISNGSSWDYYRAYIATNSGWAAY